MYYEFDVITSLEETKQNHKILLLFAENVPNNFTLFNFITFIGWRERKLCQQAKPFFLGLVKENRQKEDIKELSKTTVSRDLKSNMQKFHKQSIN